MRGLAWLDPRSQAMAKGGSKAWARRATGAAERGKRQYCRRCLFWDSWGRSGWQEEAGDPSTGSRRSWRGGLVGGWRGLWLAAGQLDQHGGTSSPSKIQWVGPRHLAALPLGPQQPHHNGCTARESAQRPRCVVFRTDEKTPIAAYYKDKGWMGKRGMGEVGPG